MKAAIRRGGVREVVESEGEDFWTAAVIAC